MITTRTRSRGNQVQVARYSNVYDQTGKLLTHLQFGIPVPLGILEVVSDVNHGNFRQKQKRGEVVMGDFALTRSERQASQIDFRFGPYAWWGNQSNGMEGDWISQVESLAWDSFESPLLAEGNDAEIALIKAYAKMNQTAVLTGESLGDVKKTVSMLKHPFKSSLQLLGKMSQHKKLLLKRKSMTLLKANADAWLEYRYGWKPLIMDAKSIMDDALLGLSRASGGQRLVARAGSSQVRIHEGTFSEKPMPGISGILVSGSGGLKQKISTSAGVLYAVAARTSAEAKSAYYGLRTREIPITLWEKVPYSFVADWFVNIGDWLEASLPAPGITVLGNWITVVTETDFHISASGKFTAYTDATTETVFTPNFGSSSTKTSTVRRTCGNELPTLPPVNRKPLSLVHLTDGGALTVAPILSALRGFRH
jgi:hypothetical protein